MRIIYTIKNNFFDIIIANYISYGFRMDFMMNELYVSGIGINYSKDNLFYDIL